MEVEADVCVRVSGRGGVGWVYGVSEMEIRRNEQRPAAGGDGRLFPRRPESPAAAFVCASVFVSVTRHLVPERSPSVVGDP